MLIGTGKRCFGDGTILAGLARRQQGLEDRRHGQHYQRAGNIKPGSFEFDEPTEAEIERRQRLATA